MGINFHITSVREGTIFNVMQFLSLEKVTGILHVSLGRNIPKVMIYFVTGNVTSAEFGAIVGDAVLDVLLCQEYSIKEVEFAPGRIGEINESALLVKASSLSGAMLNVSKDVDKCDARPLIYGLLPVVGQESKKAGSLFDLLHDFGLWADQMVKIPEGESDKQAPLPQCVLIHRALSKNVITYSTPLISLRSLGPLLSLIQPLSDKESNNLRGYLRSLLPHPKATHLPIERFYAFASAIESIAQRRSQEVGDKARRAIHLLIQNTAKSGEPANV